jgi:predicted Rossmann-fold nucleotide-binding protein
LVATGKITRFPIVLVGSTYWAGLLGWLKEKVVAEGNVHAEELDLFTVVDDPAEVVRIIKKAHAEAGFDLPRGNAYGA